jgi:hypothetical protein
MGNTLPDPDTNASNILPVVGKSFQRTAEPPDYFESLFLAANAAERLST